MGLDTPLCRGRQLKSVGLKTQLVAWLRDATLFESRLEGYEHSLLLS